MNAVHRLRRCLGSLFLACVLGMGAPVSADELVPLPRHPEGVAWPTEAWPVGPLPDGLDRATFDAQVEKLFAGKGRGGLADTRALLVIHRGRLVFERYAEGFDAGSRFQSWSMAKSVTNALVGTLVGGGRLDVEAPAPVADWNAPDDPRASITLGHLLQMRSGLDNSDGFELQQDLGLAFIARLIFGDGSTSPAAYASNVSLVHPVGTHWAYSTGSSIVLAKLCGDVVGGGSVGTRDYLQRELFQPLGMRSAQPEFAASGEFVGGAFVHATAQDWARFGYLYLRDGVWDGRRILPEGWVDYSRTASPAENNRVYGAHFWINAEPADDSQWQVLPGAPSSTFAAEGAYFQMVAIEPTRDLVAVRLGESEASPFPEIKEPFGPLISAFPERSAP